MFRFTKNVGSRLPGDRALGFVAMSGGSRYNINAVNAQIFEKVKLQL
ncbi:MULTISPECIES: hypothetical protein [Spirulina sp. CCY15215]|nr:hypothetical protein [Spirulina major]